VTCVDLQRRKQRLLTELSEKGDLLKGRRDGRGGGGGSFKPSYSVIPRNIVTESKGNTEGEKGLGEGEVSD